MGLFENTAIVITLAAILAYLNHRFLKLPTTIGLMVLALALSLGVLTIGAFAPGVEQLARKRLEAVDFDEVLLNGMLGYLLFAGALHVNLNDLRQQKFIVAALATGGVLLSTALVGAFTWATTRALGIQLPLMYCILFGALISPTDPIAVLSILKSLGAPKSLETKITGESLFNDGVGVVVFLALLEIAGLGGHQPAAAEHGADQPHAMVAVEPGHATPDEVGPAAVAKLFAVEVLGGGGFGLLLGLAGYRLLRSIDDYKTEILISLALVTGGYALAIELHISGPIAMVVAGLLIGNHGRALAMSRTTRENLDKFWELVDEVLNAVLFVLIGLEVLVLSFTSRYLLAGLLAIPATLLARFIAVSGSVAALRLRRDFSPHTAKMVTWAGLRGGISVALALSLKDLATGAGQSGAGNTVLTMTYVVVVFSIVVQGLTIGPLLGRFGLSERGDPVATSDH